MRQTMRKTTETLEAENRALHLIISEREVQLSSWGKQEHEPHWWKLILDEEVGELSKAILEDHFKYPNANPADINRELIQVAAVAYSFLVDLIERGGIK